MSTPAQTSPDPSLASVQGIKEFGKGFAGGAANTAVGLRDVAARTFNKPQLGQNPIPDVPKGLRDFSAPPTTTSGRAGRMLEQGAEAFAPIPGGVEEKILSAAAHLGTVPEVIARAGMESFRAAVVTGAQSHGDPEATARAALSAGIVSGAFSTIGGILKAIPSSSIYLTRDIKFPKRFDEDRIKEIADQAIDDGVLQTAGGAKKAEFLRQARKEDLLQAQAPFMNAPVPISVVRQPLNKMSDLADRIGDPGLKAKVQRMWTNFAEAHGQMAAIPPVPSSQVASSILDTSGNPIMKTIPGSPGAPMQPAMITLGEAQQFKEDFQNLVRSAYGTTSGDKVQMRKMLAAGLKDSIENLIPEAKQLNREAQNSLLLRNAIESYLQKNKDIVTPRTAVMMFFNKGAAITYGALQNPAIRSALAIIKDRSEGAIMSGGSKFAGRSANAVTSPTISLNPQNFSFPPIPTQGGQQ